MEVKTEKQFPGIENNMKSGLNEENKVPKFNENISKGPENFTFSNKDVRLNFIRKVYLILSCQLIFTTIFVTIVYNSPALSIFITESVWLMIIFLILYITTVILISCVDYAARTVPLNYFLLSVLTLSMSYIV